MATINPQVIIQALPTLKLNNPRLKSINLFGAYIEAATLKAILAAFPALEEINVKFIQGIDEGEIFQVLMPWISKNSQLKKIYGLTISTVEQMQSLAAAIPSTLESATLYISPNPINDDIMTLAFPAFAQKCGQKLKHLSLSGSCSAGENGSYYAITEANFTALPAQFPRLEHLNCQGYFDSTSAVIRDTLLSFPRMKSINASGFTEITIADLADVVNHFSDLKEFKDWGYNNSVNPAGLLPLAQALAKQKSLVSLDLAFTTFQAAGLDPALTALAPILPQLESFIVDWLSVTDEDMDLIASSLNSNSLKNFSLSLFSPTGATPVMSQKAYINGLLTIAKQNPDLQKLWIYVGLENPETDDANWTTLSKSFTSLRSLFLQQAAALIMPGSSVQIIKQFIDNNPNLELITTDLCQGDLQQLKSLCPQIGKTVFIESCN